MFKVLFISIWFAMHPVHVTFTSVDYIPVDESFKVFVRMNFDDFIRDYRLSVGEIREKGFSGENSSSKEEMQKYLSKKIVLTVNNKELPAILENMSLADNEVSINVIYGMIKKPRTLTVRNLIMTTLYADQSNMIIVKVNEFEEGVKLTSEVKEHTFKIK